MATAPRQPKPTRKGAPEPARRPAWTAGARASPTYSPGSTSPRPQNGPPPGNQGSFPPLSQTNGTKPSDNPPDRNLQSLAGLTGTTITLLTKTSQRYEGVVASTSGEGNTTGLTLKDVNELSNPGAPLKEHLFIASTNIDSWTSGPADAKVPNGTTDSFRTDTDISQKTQVRRDRELQAWQPGPDTGTAGGTLGKGDDLTFGPGAGAGWDQFAVNEQLFGVKTNFDEDLYTTKLDRSAADYKERERNAQRIANEIMGASTNNPHVAEERNMIVDDTGIDEEQKYGAVVRGTNAYVPPGARKPNSTLPTGAGPSATPSKAEIPKVSVNGPDGADIPSSATPPPSSKPAASTSANKPPADPLPAFRDFVTNEKQRLTQKRQALVKSEMDKRMAELVKFSQSFKLNKPIPDDLVPILAKDEEKQKSIREKSNKDATSSQARTIGVSALTTAAAAARAAPLVQQTPSKLSIDARKQAAGATPTKSTGANPGPVKAAPTAKPPADPAKATTKPAISMFIQPIPPFKGAKTSRPPASKPSSTQVAANEAVHNAAPSTSTAPSVTVAPMSPGAATKHLNANASSFRPNPKANAFNPGAPSPISTTSASISPKPKPVDTPHAANPFFGTRVIKRTPVHIKDDFNPFKNNKVVEASQVGALWPYNGKRYIQMFPPPQHPQQHSPHMQPPVQPPIPPPSYEEDSAAQAAAAARGYVYAFPPYGYPGQPMIPGMGPPGPPSGYMPAPFMPPIPYPPSMPPPNAMYAPGMGQMPPPQAYMPPPPPGQYPPPNGAGPRPSMPPTPIPSHAHPYYHQSPQLQHAYPLMMPPPAPNGPPHPYEGGPAPPVPMGGVGHA